jgi:hypothetical protein
VALKLTKQENSMNNVRNKIIYLLVEDLISDILPEVFDHDKV